MLSTLIALPYEIARKPLVIIDKSLSDKLPETFGPRVTLDRAIGSADKIAGSLLGNRDIANRGAERLKHSDTILKAAHFEQKAATRRDQAHETADAGRHEAAEKRKAAADRVASGLAEAEAAEARGKQEAQAKATKAAAAKKAAADKKADSRSETVEEHKRRVDSAAEAKKKAAQAAAKAELKDASRTKKSAAEARADAQRLSDLAEAKKQERKQH